MTVFTRLFLSLLALAVAPNAWAAREAQVRDGIEFSVSARAPEQLAAFYSARGVPQAAIAEITKTCFLTVGVHNKSRDVLWLELANWRFEDEAGQPVLRIARETWEKTWERLGVPLASRATFGWTQLPESRDLQPEEPVGGNVAVVAPPGTFKLIAKFRTGADGKGAPIEMRVNNLSCPAGTHP